MKVRPAGETTSMLHHHLPVAVHVSRREAGRYLERAQAGQDASDAFFDDVTRRISERFGKGRKLTGPDFREMEADVLAGVAHMSPLVTHTLRLAPTRGRPKGEAVEILAVSPYASVVDGTEVCHLGAMRFYLDRRRATVDNEQIGLCYLRHMLERAVEREMVDREGGFAEIEDALFAHQGFVAAWRRAVSRGLARLDHDLHLPFKGGLLLGTTFATQDNMPGTRHVNNRTFGGSAPVSQSPFRVADVGRGAPAFIDWVGRTAVPWDALSPEQLDYHDAAVAFSERHAKLFRRISELAPWTHPELCSPLQMADVADDLDVAAREIAVIVASPHFERVYRDRRHMETNPAFSRRMAA